MVKPLDESVFESKNIYSRYLIMIISLFISAVLFNTLISPVHIVIGGIPGLSLINKKLYNINPATTIFVLEIVMLIISFIFLGKQRTKGTIVACIIYPLFVYITEPIVDYINIDYSDLLVISIFIGVISGFSNGLLYKTGFSNGGLPVISQILYKYFNISIGKTNLIINTIIVLLGSLLFGTNMIMYAIIINYINSLIVDKILLGISKNKALYILTSESEKVIKFLTENMNHSATILDSTGGYHNKNSKMLLTVIPTREYFEVSESIKVIDPNVFYVVSNAYEVKGGK